MRIINTRLKISMEDPALDVPNNEVELMYIGELKDLQDLQSAQSHEKQEQWTFRVPQKGSFRVRCVNDTDCTFTTKLDTESRLKKEEITTEISKEQFNAFKAMSHEGMEKTRFFFPVQDSDLVWEVDVFYNEDGSFFPWVKMDLEVNQPIDAVPPFPFTLNKVFAPSSPNCTAEDKALSDQLFKEHFVKRVEGIAE